MHSVLYCSAGFAAFTLCHIYTGDKTLTSTKFLVGRVLYAGVRQEMSLQVVDRDKHERRGPNKQQQMQFILNKNSFDSSGFSQI